MNMPSLPKESESQEIGDRALDALTYQRPDGWKIDQLPGSHDVGIDLHIQVVKDKSYQFPFRAQVKGSTIDASNSDKSYLSVPLRVSTSTYLKRADLVMLVFADFSADPRPESAPVHYVWLNEVLQDRLKELETSGGEQVEITIRVPAAQRITKTLDISQYWETETRRRESMATLNKAIAGVNVGVATEVRADTLAANVEKGGAVFVESTLGEVEFPWPEAKAGTNGWVLRKLRDAITEGIEAEALNLEKRVLELTLRDDVERAEASYQRGRLALLGGRAGEAAELYAAASALLPRNSRFECARIEALLAVTDHSEIAKGELGKLEASENANEPRIAALRARLHIILDQFDAAAALLEGLNPQVAILEQTLLATMLHDESRVVELDAQAKTLDIPRQTRLSVSILAARALFAEVFRVPTGESIPPSGPPELNVARLQGCWNYMYELALELKSSRWPVNSHLLLDVLGAVAVAAGKANQALVLIDDFLRERPQYSEFQELRMKLALNANRTDIALLAIDSMPKDDARAVREVLMSYAATDYQRAIVAVPQLLAAPDNADPMLGEALLVAAICADRLFRKQESEACLVRLKQLPGSETFVAVYRFVSRANAGEEAFEESLTELRAEYAKDKESQIIQDHLITALRPSRKDEAEIALTIVSQIAARRQLFGQEVVHVARCLETFDRRAEALAQLESARLRLPDDVDIAALQALLLEKHGDSKRALDLLESLTTLDSPVAERCRAAFINLAARNGLIDLAIKQFEALLVRAKDNKEKGDILRSLFSLELHRDGSTERLNYLAFAYGEFADQADEYEEAMFLQLVLTAGMRAEKPLPKERQEEFTKRSEAFFAAHPNSEYISAVQIPKEATPEELLQLIRSKLGLTEEQIVAFEANKNALERGTMLAPYAWRPRALLQNITAVSHLWELTKRSRDGSKAYALLLSPKFREGNDLRAFRQIPLIDLPTLILLTELDLWKILLRVFGRIAISKWTLLRIQTDAGPMGFPTDVLLRLRAAIREDFGQIIEPGSFDEDWMKVRDGGLTEMQEILKEDRFAFYSDDHLARLFVLGDEAASGALTIVDLLETAEIAGMLDVVEVAAKYAQLVRWNVGVVPIFYKHLMASIPPAVDDVRTVAEKFDVLSASPNFRSLVDAVWSFGNPYPDVANHFTSVLARMLNEGRDLNQELSAAIFGLWFIKAMLRPDVPVQPDAHLAHVMALVFKKVADREEAIRKAWGVYLHVVALRNGDRMDNAIEKEAIALVGETVTRTFRKKGDVAGGVMLATKIRKGLTRGLPDDDAFEGGSNRGQRG